MFTKVLSQAVFFQTIGFCPQWMKFGLLIISRNTLAGGGHRSLDLN